MITRPERRAYTPEELLGAHVVVSIVALDSVHRAEVRDIEKDCVISNVAGFYIYADCRREEGKVKLKVILERSDASLSPSLSAEAGPVTISTQVAQVES
jgi:hypothetical protein